MLSQFEKYTEKDYTIKLWTQYGYKTLNQKHCTSFVMQSLCSRTKQKQNVYKFKRKRCEYLKGEKRKTIKVFHQLLKRLHLKNNL